MAAQRQIHGAVVVDDLVAFAGCFQLDRVITARCRAQQVTVGHCAHGMPERSAPVSGQLAQGITRCQRLQGVAVQSGAPGQVIDIGKGAFGPGLLDTLRRLFGHAAQQAHAQPYGRTRLPGGVQFQNGFPAAAQDVHRQDLDPMPACILDQLGGRVKAHGLAVEQAAQEGFRLVALEPAAEIGQQGKAGGMAFGETVFAETLDLVEDALGEFT